MCLLRLASVQWSSKMSPKCPIGLELRILMDSPCFSDAVLLQLGLSLAIVQALGARLIRQRTSGDSWWVGGEIRSKPWLFHHQRLPLATQRASQWSCQKWSQETPQRSYQHLSLVWRSCWLFVLLVYLSYCHRYHFVSYWRCAGDFAQYLQLLRLCY